VSDAERDAKDTRISRRSIFDGCQTTKSTVAKAALSGIDELPIKDKARLDPPDERLVHRAVMTSTKAVRLGLAAGFGRTRDPVRVAVMSMSVPFAGLDCANAVLIDGPACGWSVQAKRRR
jgi:hypothetical protein